MSALLLDDASKPATPLTNGLYRFIWVLGICFNASGVFFTWVGLNKLAYTAVTYDQQHDRKRVKLPLDDISSTAVPVAYALNLQSLSWLAVQTR